MAIVKARRTYGDLKRLASSGSLIGQTDADLIAGFAGRGGDEAEAAFKTILGRHGPMVVRTCRACTTMLSRQRSSPEDDSLRASNTSQEVGHWHRS